MWKVMDLVGNRYGKLTVLRRGTNTKGGSARWVCLCDCGEETVVNSKHLRTGHTSSCGCLAHESRKTHGMSGSSEYRCWRSMLSRCLCPQNTAYALYGGSGITVCQRWVDSFSDFLSDVGRRPSLSHTLDRIDNSQGYEPNNVRWATKTQQIQNRECAVVLTIDGITKPITEWSKVSGVPSKTIYDRYRLGKSSRDAVFRPWRVQKALPSLATGVVKSASAEYRAWKTMISRCTRQSDRSYENYGGRGVAVCSEWMLSFDTFLADVGFRPTDAHSLDRIDCNGDYCKDNCRWATVVVQSSNRRSARVFTANGETQTVAEWARRCGVSHSMILRRIEILHWPVEQAVTTKKGVRRQA
jgi:hypothetical protein